MATLLPRGPFRDETYVAAEDLSDYQYHQVDLTSATTVSASDANDESIGILQNAPASGEQAIVRTKGESLCVADGTTDIDLTDGVDADASAHAVKQAADKGWVVGFAREAYTSATPGLIVVDVNPQTLSV